MEILLAPNLPMILIALTIAGIYGWSMVYMGSRKDKLITKIMEAKGSTSVDYQLKLMALSFKELKQIYAREVGENLKVVKP